jgi:competence protein ComGC
LHRVDAVGAVIIMLMIVSILLLIAILEATARRTIRQQGKP